LKCTCRVMKTVPASARTAFEREARAGFTADLGLAAGRGMESQ